MKNGKIAPPGYVLPNRPRWQGGWNLRSLFGALLAFTLVAGAATEWLAIRLHNPIEMGEPLFRFAGTPVYQPFAALMLWKHFAGSRLISSGVRMDLWIALGVTIVGGLFLAYLTYWFLSLIRDNKSTDSLMNLHGSATWATREDIEKIGLFDATDGVYVGGWRDPNTQQIHYLLHSGAEPVLLFAPSRSGKGVSAIIPTLCQWRQSVFVYDLKGENWEKSAGFRHAIGQRVLKFAPTLPAESCCYNPLSEIRWETDYEVGCFLPLIIALGVLYSGAVNLSCTRDEVQATWIRFGKVKRILTFQGADVKQVRYVAGSNPLSGRADYLSFLAGGKLVKCLPGLKCVEAQLILNELERMGFDVVRDPEMPTMVQVEQSRRHG